MPFTLESLRAARAILDWAVEVGRMTACESRYLAASIARCERELVSCATKESYASWYLADQIARRARVGHCKAYHYQCGYWHVGSVDPVKRRQLKRQMREHLRAMRDDMETA